MGVGDKRAYETPGECHWFEYRCDCPDCGVVIDIKYYATAKMDTLHFGCKCGQQIKVENGIIYPDGHLYAVQN